MNTGIKTLICSVLLWLHLTCSAASAPYSAIVIEANTNEIVHSVNADAISHPAGLTKLAALYVALSEVEAGNISLDTMIRISRKATEEAEPTLGLREGQRIQLRHLRGLQQFGALMMPLRRSQKALQDQRALLQRR